MPKPPLLKGGGTRDHEHITVICTAPRDGGIRPPLSQHHIPNPSVAAVIALREYSQSTAAPPPFSKGGFVYTMRIIYYIYISTPQIFKNAFAMIMLPVCDG